MIGRMTMIGAGLLALVAAGCSVNESEPRSGHDTEEVAEPAGTGVAPKPDDDADASVVEPEAPSEQEAEVSGHGEPDAAEPDAAEPEAPPSGRGAEFIGKTINEDATADEIVAATGGRMARVYTQGDMLTMDFVEGRVNIEVDHDGRIAAIWFDEDGPPPHGE